MAQNKGEWSELYVILHLLTINNLELVDSDFCLIDNKIFTITNIVSFTNKNDKVEFTIKNDKVIIKTNNIVKTITKESIIKIKQILLEQIKKNHKTKGSFDIPSIESWLKDNNIGQALKSKSTKKEDVILITFDNAKNEKRTLSYSIKSQLGKPATLLNASNSTNFKYRVNNLTEKQIKEINLINTRKKLIDKLQRIYQYNGKITFEKTVNKTFENNLKEIDENLDKALASILLNSYKDNEKRLSKLFSKVPYYKDNWNEKLGSFLHSVSFNIMPSTSSKFNVNGGIIIVDNKANVYVLDLIYHKKEVINYLIKETVLDTPSPSRYDILNLKEDENGVYFTLNLQIRYKKST